MKPLKKMRRGFEEDWDIDWDGTFDEEATGTRLFGGNDWKNYDRSSTYTYDLAEYYKRKWK